MPASTAGVVRPDADEGRPGVRVVGEPEGVVGAEEQEEEPLPGRLGEAGQVRPDIVWFGEMPYEMETIEEALRHCDLFVSIGTSGAVYPAAGYVQTARYCGARTIEINLEPSQGSGLFDETRLGKAGELVPMLVEELLVGS